MREIKFRVWDKLSNRMIYLDDGNPHHTFSFIRGYASYYNLQNGSGGNEYELMQFTGLYDKNGNPIYEGDVVKKSYDNSIGEIIWMEEGIGYGIKIYNPKDATEWPGFLELEVIGNIYENPELLEGK